jgi:thiol-disulfide isomerase/thioredoxin
MSDQAAEPIPGRQTLHGGINEASDVSRPDKTWVVPFFLKSLFFWSSLAMVAGLIWYKVDERFRYQSILVESVMDPMPVNRTAPPFELGDGEGGTPVSLASLKGRWVFVNFWATWCPPCREEMPSMEFMARKFGKDMAIVAVTVDEDWNEVKRFFGPEKPSFRVLWDPRKQVTRQYGTEKFPESFLVSPDGRVVAKFVGPRDWNNQASEEYFQKILKGG